MLGNNPNVLGGRSAGSAAAGSGDVTAASSFGTDEVLIRSDGTGKGVQSTGITVDDSDNMTIPGDVTADNLDVGAISISRTLGTDDTYSGTVITDINGGATIAQWEAVYYGFADTEWLLADANGTGTYPAQGLAVAATTNGAAATVLTQGFVRNDAWNWSAGDIYLSATPGGLTQTAPSTSGDKVQVVGFAVSADVAYFHFNPTYVEVA